jgi:hypothetical protein
MKNRQKGIKYRLIQIIYLYLNLFLLRLVYILLSILNFSESTIQRFETILFLPFSYLAFRVDIGDWVFIFLYIFNIVYTIAMFRIIESNLIARFFLVLVAIFSLIATGFLVFAYAFTHADWNFGT